MLIPTLIERDLCLKDVDLNSNLELYTYTHNAYTHARKPCSGAYSIVVESSVVYSVDTIGNR
jgi:hypothetical protein